MKYQLLVFILLLTVLKSSSQTINGKVMSEKQEPLIGATVLLPKSQRGVITDINGTFILENIDNETQIIIRFVGYQSDTVNIAEQKFIKIHLKENTSELDAVIVKSSSTFMDNLEPIHAEIITEKELLKGACCNLSESFETNASVDVSFTDAVSGTKTIRMLGLDGKYTVINRENMPHVRGLSSRQGLNYIPGTWIQSIDVGKGAGSVVNGYESMTGQINMEFKKPGSSEKLYLNAYANSFGRVEANANTSYQINENWSGALLTHGSYFGNEIDQNHDSFMDLPKSKQFNVLNRYKYRGERVESQIGFNVLQTEKAGGQSGFDFKDDASNSPLYGFSSNVNRFEIFGKTGLLFPQSPYKGWGLIYSGSFEKQGADFGRRSYSGKQKNVYINLIHQNIIGNTFHQYKAGSSFLLDDYDEVFADSSFTRTEIVPGAFLEYSYLPNDKFTLVGGIRTDIHNLYGIYVTPRLHIRYEVMRRGILRVSAGKGYRTSNIIAENTQAFVSSRKLVVKEKLDPEESWNFGGSFTKEIYIGSEKINLIADYFHTRFQNQVVTDLDQNSSEVSFYNLNGKSFANSYQVEIAASIDDHFSTKGAYKYYDVKSTIDNELISIPFISKHRAFWNLAYASKFEKWKADLTLQWYGRKRLPDTKNKPLEHQRANYSPDFTNINMQVSRTFRWGNVYLGSENVLDFKQKNPIIDPQNPFSENFDGSLVWGPIAGRLVYFGVRYEIN
ncbi:MAG: carboxypeptidase-like regulatory domain-containing protein [Cyclobacteriaceae bacterium]